MKARGPSSACFRIYFDPYAYLTAKTISGKLNNPPGLAKPRTVRIISSPGGALSKCNVFPGTASGDAGYFLDAWHWGRNWGDWLVEYN